MFNGGRKKTLRNFTLFAQNNFNWIFFLINVEKCGTNKCEINCKILVLINFEYFYFQIPFFVNFWIFVPFWIFSSFQFCTILYLAQLFNLYKLSRAFDLKFQSYSIQNLKIIFCGINVQKCGTNNLKCSFVDWKVCKIKISKKAAVDVVDKFPKRNLCRLANLC